MDPDHLASPFFDGDARIFDGTSEIQHLIIARNLLRS